jgi:hypothetical protein
MNPWFRARDAERRAAVAEERAAFLEQELNWMKAQVENSRASEVTALKISCNIGYQQSYGMTPFPEVASVPPREDSIRKTEGLFGTDPRSQAFSEFKQRELERFASLNRESEPEEVALKAD